VVEGFSMTSVAIGPSIPAVAFNAPEHQAAHDGRRWASRAPPATFGPEAS
jgi:hypothetical protein